MMKRTVAEERGGMGRFPCGAARRRGWTAVELLILAGLLVLLALMIVPRLTREAAADQRAELVGRLATLRNAIDLYAAEHQGAFPSVERFEEQLTGRSGEDGAEAVDEEPGEGAYLDEIPALPLGRYKGMNGVVDGSYGRPGARRGGWFYNPDNGRIRANLPDRATDPRGMPYNRYGTMDRCGLPRGRDDPSWCSASSGRRLRAAVCRAAVRSFVFHIRIRDF